MVVPKVLFSLRLWRWLLLTTIATFLSYCAVIFCVQKRSASVRAATKPSPSPLIVAYTQFFYSDIFSFMQKWEEGHKCPFACRYSTSPGDYAVADVALFHAKNFNFDNKFTLLSPNAERLNVFLTWETPRDELRRWMRKGMPANFFNLTVTYHSTSTIWAPYNLFDPIQEGDANNLSLIWTEEEVDRVLHQKDTLAVQFVSHCTTKSRREAVVERMQRFANISVFGTCNNRICDKDVCQRTQIQRSYFYLAFENSLCDEYFTEKFWALKKLIVPVVLKRSAVKKAVPKNLFLAVDDFATTEELVAHMLYLANHKEEYRKYFAWTKFYRHTFYRKPVLCRLCEMAVKKEKYELDFAHWWNNKFATCTMFDFS